MLSHDFLRALKRAVGPDYVRTSPDALEAYAADALGRGQAPDVVVLPGGVEEVVAVARLCHADRMPLTPRGAGTG